MFHFPQESFPDRCPSGQNYIFWWGNPSEVFFVSIENADYYSCFYVNSYCVLDDLFRVKTFIIVKCPQVKASAIKTILCFPKFLVRKIWRIDFMYRANINLFQSISN